MTIAKSMDDLNIIAKLNKEPNDVGGLTYQQLQAKFDEGVITLQTYVNGMVDILNSVEPGGSGAENIGCAPIAGLVGNNIYEQLEQLYAVAQSAQAGATIDGSIEDIKLSNTEGQIKERVATHIADSDIHITSAERTAWNNANISGKIYAYKNLGGAL